MTMPVPKACQSLADQLEAARKELEHIQGLPGYIEGPEGPRPGKPDPGLLEEAEHEEALIRRLSGQLDACLREHGICPTQLSTFSGRATLSSSKGSGHSHFSIILELKEPHHHDFFVESFPPLDVEAGGHDLTITQTGGGNGHIHAGGRADLQIDLRVDAAWPGGHLTLPITLSTEKEHGSRLDAHGNVTLAGKGTGHGSGAGFPDQIEISIVAKGAISPPPCDQARSS
jgi:hypothetical protein